MNDSHEPTRDFVERLEAHVGLEARRRNRVADAPRRPWWLSAKAVGALMLLSMGIGGAAVATAYEAQASGRREQVAIPYVQRVELAKQKLDLVKNELASAERRFSVGMSTQLELLEAGLALADARAQIDITQLELAEVQITGEDRRNELSAPLVSGRDFVTQRLAAAMSVPQQALDHAKKVLQHAQVRVEIGTSSPMDLEMARARIAELTMAIGTFQRKLDIRKQFLAGKMDKVEAELRVLEAEADQRMNAVEPQLNLARQEAAQLAAKKEAGAAQEIDVARATLRVLELQLAMTKARMELTIVRQRIQEHRAGRL